ncbi:MAG: TIGR02453 family protein [Thermaurantiacus sp.]
MIPKDAFRLLAELEANNHRDWFQANRDAIRSSVQEPFAEVLGAISEELAGADLPLSGGADTMFRMNRDVRFSADKSPYNASASGLLTPSGNKDESAGIMYLHMDKDGGFLACGFYKMPTSHLNTIRDRIVARPDAFRAAIDDLSEAGLALSSDMMLKGMPRGYADHADAWFAEHLRRKVLIVREDLDTESWTSGAVVATAAGIARASAGLLRFGAAA